MNVTATTTPVIATVAGSGSGSSGSGKSGGAGAFAGLLVQTIGGEAAKPSAGATLLVPGAAGIPGLWNAIGGEGEPSLTELLKQLTELLERLQAETAAEAAEAANDAAGADGALLALLPMLQQLLAQLTRQQTALGSAEGSVGADAAPGEGTASQALQVALLQMTAAALGTRDESTARETKPLIEQLRAALAGQTLLAGGTVGSAQGVAAFEPTDARTALQTTHVPLWRLALGTTQPATADGASSDAAAQQTAGAQTASDPVPVWTMQRDAAAGAAKPEQAGATLPAQVPVQQFAEEMEKFLVKQFVLTKGNGVTEAKISLHPEHLGQVDIRIVMQGGQLTAQFVTDSGMARELLENGMLQLRAALQAQGLQVERMEVVQQPDPSASTANFLQQQDRGGREGGAGRQGGGAGGREDGAAFEAELDRTTFLREIGFGSSLNVTA